MPITFTVPFGFLANKYQLGYKRCVCKNEAKEFHRAVESNQYVAKADGYVGKTAPIPIFATEEGKLCDIAKKFYHFLGHTPSEIQEKDDLFQRGELIVINERYCLIHILPINIVNNSHQKYVYINYQSIRT